MNTREAARVAVAKREMRSRLLARRALRSSDECLSAAEAFCGRALGLPEIGRARSVCCYLSMPGEPDTGPLLDALCAGGTTVLLPVLLPDLDLDWAAYSPKDSALQRGRFGLREPTMPALGVSAVAGADVVVCPGIAVDLAGHRLGRGGGSYDRALRRLSPGTPRVVLVYDDEVLDAVPVTDHDEPVHIALTPTRTLRLPAAVGT